MQASRGRGGSLGGWDFEVGQVATITDAFLFLLQVNTIRASLYHCAAGGIRASSVFYRDSRLLPKVKHSLAAWSTDLLSK